MPGFYDDNDDEFEQGDQPGPKGLRSKLAAVEAEKKALEAELSTLRESNATLSKQVKSTTLRQALTEAGIDPKYARFAERDEVEPTPEAVANWVDENKDVYAFLNKPAAPAADEVEGEQDGPEDQLPEGLAEALTASQGIESAGRPRGSTNLIEVLEGTDPSKFESAEAVDAFIRSLGAPTRAG